MKRITKSVYRRYGKVYNEEYHLEVYDRDWYTIFKLGIIPVSGWIFLFWTKPYKKSWQVEATFGTLEELKYYLTNECKFKIEKHVIGEL